MCKYSGVLRKGETESKRKRERRKKKKRKEEEKKKIEYTKGRHEKGTICMYECTSKELRGKILLVRLYYIE